MPLSLGDCAAGMDKPVLVSTDQLAAFWTAGGDCSRDISRRCACAHVINGDQLSSELL